MKEKPVLFNAEMVRAILDGRKTQTRRTLKIQPPTPDHVFSEIVCSTKRGEAGKYRWVVAEKNRLQDVSKSFPLPCRVGDVFWVREAFHTGPDGYSYRADGDWIGHMRKYGAFGCDDKWTPSLHMPKAACRLKLEITNVRIERLQDISEADAFAEGVTPEPCDHARRSCEEIGCCGDTSKGEFGALWKSIYGAESWQANPWVWCITFKRMEE